MIYHFTCHQPLFMHVYHPGRKRNALHTGVTARSRVVYIPLRTSHVGTRMDCESIKLKHVYHPLNGVCSTIHVFVQLKPALARQVLYMCIHNSTTYYINEYKHCSSVTKHFLGRESPLRFNHPQAELGLLHT